MIKGIKIGWLSLLLMMHIIAGAQSEQVLLPFSHPLLINPSYAGWKKNTTVWNSIHSAGHPENKLNHTYTLTYDTWSERLKGGIALYFFQGLTGEVNSNSTGAGFTFSKPIETGLNGSIIPAIHFNAKKVFKQWFVQAIDGLVAEEILQPSPPGKEFLRSNLYQPRLGLLWDSKSIDLGVAGSFTFQQNVSEETNIQYNPQYHFILHISGETNGYRKGLISEPYKTSPELILLYAKNILLSRAGIKWEHKDHLYGLSVQNHFTDNIHGINAVYGRKFQNFRITFAAGSGYDFTYRRMTFLAEATLGLAIPYVEFDQNNPWAVPGKKY